MSRVESRNNNNNNNNDTAAISTAASPNDGRKMTNHIYKNIHNGTSLYGPSSSSSSLPTSSTLAMLPGIIHNKLDTITAELSKVKDKIRNVHDTMIQMERSFQSRENERMERWISEIGRRLLQGLDRHQVVDSPSTRVHNVDDDDDDDDIADNGADGADANRLLPMSNSQPPTEDGAVGRMCQEGEPSPPSIPATCKKFSLQPRHKNLQSVWNEWHGLGNFHNKPIPGGIARAEELWKAKWRRHFEGREKKLFTRLRAVITAMKRVENQDWSQLEEAFLGPCKTSMSKMDDYLKAQGIISKRRPRGRNAAFVK